ncbi:hypothetical protein H6F88_27830 [Oculatella sp. FACHB-28]|uniref:hypothetical protein n=1 Tax=Oculatella sp. FACHB-28 TaxID=2692845 RepID=UPI0016838C4F|nr:hypothetical protein [Oculatella sp. FACHB-28]MBD2059751.1 hypothetical protein [Oculatella sp. FACHB-28]
MPKQILKDEEIYIAPGIIGKYEDGNPIAIDEKSGKRLDPKNIDDKIFIYEREVTGWFLDPASALLEGKHRFENSFIVLMICMSYFEGVEQYKTGEQSSNRSRVFFINSVKRMYPKEFQDEELRKLYSKSRCGLFHNGMVKGGVIFSSNFENAIEFQKNGEVIKVNPRLLLKDIKEDFENYIIELRRVGVASCRIARENFDRMFTVLE